MNQFDKLRSANSLRDAEWDPKKLLSASFKGLELGGETGEVQNKIKKLERERLNIRGSRTNLSELAEELADVIICADLIAMHYGIHLWVEVAAKFNKTSENNGLKTRINPYE